MAFSTARLTADWFWLEDSTCFRKFEIYPLDLHDEFAADKTYICSAPYSALFALQKGNGRTSSYSTLISIYSASGRLLSSFRSYKRCIKLVFTLDEHLLFCSEDGFIILYNMYGTEQSNFNILEKSTENELSDAKLFNLSAHSTGLAVITSNFKIYMVNNVLDPKIRQIYGLAKPLTKMLSWDVYFDEMPIFIYSTGKDILRIKADEIQANVVNDVNINCAYTQVLSITISINNKHIAIFTDSGYVWMGSTDFKSKYCEVDTTYILTPKQMIWCGEDAIVVYWIQSNAKHIILVISKFGGQMSFNYDSVVHLTTELDCARIISSAQHEIIQQIPDVLHHMFRINSHEPGSHLMEASRQFQKGSHLANDYLGLIKKNLPEAVEQCLDAVSYEFNTTVQKTILRAAQFGKCFITDYIPDRYVQTIRLLRVLNSLRDPHVALPLTAAQFKNLGEGIVLDRLIARQEYFIAIEIAKFLRLPDDIGVCHILLAWAKYRVRQTHLNEEVIAKDIADKLCNTNCTSFSEIAMAAANCGRKNLAIKLLDYECRSNEQVKLLLELNQYGPALVKAIKSGDTNLVFEVILQLRKNMPQGDFKLTIREYPLAQALYKNYCKLYDTQGLEAIYRQEDDYIAQAEHHLIEVEHILKKGDVASVNISTLRTHLLLAIELFKRSKHTDLNVQLCEEYLRLFTIQKQINEDWNYHHTPIGQSLYDSYSTLLSVSEHKWAVRIKNEFRINDRQYYWLRIQSLANQDHWVELERFAKVKKSPIGYAPFVDVCLSKGQSHEAYKYLPRLSDSLKVRYYIKAKLYEEAACIAFEQKDLQGLLFVQSKCDNRSPLATKINNYIQQLNSRRK